jgi:hypothetical protein
LHFLKRYIRTDEQFCYNLRFKSVFHIWLLLWSFEITSRKSDLSKPLITWRNPTICNLEKPAINSRNSKLEPFGIFDLIKFR